MREHLNTRFINGCISGLLLVAFMAHAAFGSLAVRWGRVSSLSMLIWLGVALMLAHLVLCILTSQQMLTDKVRPPSARKQRHLVLKWLTGAALVVVAVAHIAAIRCGLPFNGWVFIVIALLLLLTLASHAIVGTKSLLKALNLPRSLRLPLRLLITATSLAPAIIILWP